MRTHNNQKITHLSYEPDADVLSWEISTTPIEYATEVDDMVVHFSKENKPVLIEVLNAKVFMQRAERIVGVARVHPEMAMA